MKDDPTRSGKRSVCAKNLLDTASNPVYSGKQPCVLSCNLPLERFGGAMRCITAVPFLLRLKSFL